MKKIARAINFGVWYFMPLIKRLYALGIKKQNKIGLIIESNNITEQPQELFQSLTTIKVRTKNAFCVVFDSHYFPIWSDDVILKIQYPIKPGNNILKFKALGFFNNSKFVYTLKSRDINIETIGPPKKNVITAPKHILRNSGKIHVGTPKISKNNILSNNLGLHQYVISPSRSPNKAKVLLDMAELERELNINSNLNQNKYE
jgi:hypothetical protein